MAEGPISKRFGLTPAAPAAPGGGIAQRFGLKPAGAAVAEKPQILENEEGLNWDERMIAKGFGSNLPALKEFLERQPGVGGKPTGFSIIPDKILGIPTMGLSTLTQTNPMRQFDVIPYRDSLAVRPKGSTGPYRPIDPDTGLFSSDIGGDIIDLLPDFLSGGIAGVGGTIGSAVPGGTTVGVGAGITAGEEFRKRLGEEYGLARDDQGLAGLGESVKTGVEAAIIDKALRGLIGTHRPPPPPTEMPREFPQFEMRPRPSGPPEPPPPGGPPGGGGPGAPLPPALDDTPWLRRPFSEEFGGPEGAGLPPVRFPPPVPPGPRGAPSLGGAIGSTLSGEGLLPWASRQAGTRNPLKWPFKFEQAMEQRFKKRLNKISGYDKQQADLAAERAAQDLAKKQAGEGRILETARRQEERRQAKELADQQKLDQTARAKGEKADIGQATFRAGEHQKEIVRSRVDLKKAKADLREAQNEANQYIDSQTGKNHAPPEVLQAVADAERRVGELEDYIQQNTLQIAELRSLANRMRLTQAERDAFEAAAATGKPELYRPGGAKGPLVPGEEEPPLPPFEPPGGGEEPPTAGPTAPSPRPKTPPAAPAGPQAPPAEPPIPPSLREAQRLAEEYPTVSVSHLQRRMQIGYADAVRLMEELERRGIVGPLEPGAHRRQVLTYKPKMPAGTPERPPILPTKEELDQLDQGFQERPIQGPEPLGKEFPREIAEEKARMEREGPRTGEKHPPPLSPGEREWIPPEQRVDQDLTPEQLAEARAAEEAAFLEKQRARIAPQAKQPTLPGSGERQYTPEEIAKQQAAEKLGGKKPKKLRKRPPSEPGTQGELWDKMEEIRRRREEKGLHALDTDTLDRVARDELDQAREAPQPIPPPSVAPEMYPFKITGKSKAAKDWLNAESGNKDGTFDFEHWEDADRVMQSMMEEGHVIHRDFEITNRGEPAFPPPPAGFEDLTSAEIAAKRKHWEGIRNAPPPEVPPEVKEGLPKAEEGLKRRAGRIPKSIQEVADDHQVDAQGLWDRAKKEAQEQKFSGKLEGLEEYQRVKQLTGLTPHKISRWENAGKDLSSWPGLDDDAAALAAELHWPETKEDWARKVWEMMRNPPPKKTGLYNRRTLERLASEMPSKGEEGLPPFETPEERGGPGEEPPFRKRKQEPPITPPPPGRAGQPEPEPDLPGGTLQDYIDALGQKYGVEMYERDLDAARTGKGPPLAGEPSLPRREKPQGVIRTPGPGEEFPPHRAGQEAYEDLRRLMNELKGGRGQPLRPAGPPRTAPEGPPRPPVAPPGGPGPQRPPGPPRVAPEPPPRPPVPPPAAGGPRKPPPPPPEAPPAAPGGPEPPEPPGPQKDAHTINMEAQEKIWAFQRETFDRVHELNRAAANGDIPWDQRDMAVGELHEIRHAEERRIIDQRNRDLVALGEAKGMSQKQAINWAAEKVKQSEMEASVAGKAERPHELPTIAEQVYKAGPHPPTMEEITENVADRAADRALGQFRSQVRIGPAGTVYRATGGAVTRLLAILGDWLEERPAEIGKLIDRAPPTVKKVLLKLQEIHRSRGAEAARRALASMAKTGLMAGLIAWLNRPARLPHKIGR